VSDSKRRHRREEERAGGDALVHAQVLVAVPEGGLALAVEPVVLIKPSRDTPVRPRRSPLFRSASARAYLKPALVDGAVFEDELALALEAAYDDVPCIS
jgi:hypothetical protein